MYVGRKNKDSNPLYFALLLVCIIIAYHIFILAYPYIKGSSRNESKKELEILSNSALYNVVEISKDYALYASDVDKKNGKPSRKGWIHSLINYEDGYGLHIKSDNTILMWEKEKEKYKVYLTKDGKESTQYSDSPPIESNIDSIDEEVGKYDELPEDIEFDYNGKVIKCKGKSYIEETDREIKSVVYLFTKDTNDLIGKISTIYDKAAKKEHAWRTVYKWYKDMTFEEFDKHADIIRRERIGNGKKDN